MVTTGYSGGHVLGHASTVDTGVSRWQHRSMDIIFKCLRCGRLREWIPSCQHCSEGSVEPLVLMTEESDQRVEATADAGVTTRSRPA